MNSLPRSYQSETDLEKMCALLQAGEAAPGSAYYIHTGELYYCLFNWLDGYDPWQHIYLWDDPDHPDRLLGWALLSTPWSAFDVFVQPALWHTGWACDINTWIEEKAIEKARQQGHSKIWRMNVSEADAPLRQHVTARGFQEEPAYTMLKMECDLGRKIVPSLKPGYATRQVRQHEQAKRAAAQYAAFKMDKPFEEYLRQYQHFMTSPAYARGCDWVIVAPDQRFVSFCMVWPDPVTRLGLVDPLGTHPDCQRQGFGKMILETGLQYLQSVGMHSARLIVEAENAAAIRLYESCGFRVKNRLLTNQKTF